MSKLVERLRWTAAGTEDVDGLVLLLREAADALERLEADMLAAVTHIEGLVAELQADIDQCPFHGPVAHWDLP